MLCLYRIWFLGGGNETKERGKTMRKKLLCVLLSLLLAFGQTLAICAEQTQQSTTELGQIQQTAADQQTAEMEAEYELSQLPLYDRYIVKLKPTNSLAAAANTSIDMAVEAAIPAAKQAANTQVKEVLTEKQITEDTELFDLSETPAYTVDEQSAELLTVTLTEKVDAAAFTAELADNAQIEYIQPDYQLELASQKVELTIDLSEINTAEPLLPSEPEAIGTPAPEVPMETLEPVPTPEVTLTPTESPEVSQAPEVTAGPETTVEPEEPPTPTPDATATPEPSASPEITPIVAVIDSGIDVAHHGLTAQMLPGYDFVNSTELNYDFSRKSEYVHGTHVAGIIAQNAPTAQILPLKVFEYGRAYTSDILRAIEYAEEHGASVVNMSFGGADDNRALREAMQASDMLFVCAAGNHRLDVEETPIYPACFDLDNIISVASLNQDLGFSYYSNYGTESVDIAAVGRDVYSMWPEGEYGEMSGTSQAAAQVSAGAAEALARGDANVKSAVLERADRYTHLMNKVADGRSLNLENIESGVQSGEVLTTEYEDDFDVHGYQPTPEENWELFSSWNTVDVATGSEHTLVLKANGFVWGWGNSWGTGVGNNIDTHIPNKVPGLKNVISIAASSINGAALTENGEVYIWGMMAIGGTPIYRYFPVKQGEIPGAKKIITHGYCGVIVLCEDGTVWESGIDQLNVGYSAPDYTWRQRTELSNIVDIESCGAIRSDGTVFAWDVADPVLIGPDDLRYHYQTVELFNLPGATTFAQKDNDLIITSNHTLYQVVHDGATHFPSMIMGNVKYAASYDISHMAVLMDGSVYSWKGVDEPVLVSSISDIERLSMGLEFAIYLTNNQRLYGWGSNNYGQIGTGEDVNFYDSPVRIGEPISDMEGWMEAEQITVPCENKGLNSLGWYTFVAPFTAQYTFYADGNAIFVYDERIGTPDEFPIISSGEAPSGTTEPYTLFAGEHYYINVYANQYYTITVRMITPTVSIAAGNGHSLAMDENGGILASGRGNYGQLGNGVREHSATPVQVKDSTGSASFSDVVAVAAGAGFSLALKEDGTLWTWGVATGFLTSSGDSHSDIPIQVKDEDGQPLTGIVSVSAKGGHWLALKSDGTVWSWGGNESGQLGNGETENVYTHAVQVRNADGTPLEDVAAVAAGAYHSMALKTNGSVWSWGKNENGQLGNQSTENATYPVLVNSVAGVEQIAAGEFHSMCMKSDGSVWAWGRNQYGQLGDNTRNSSLIPVQVKGESGVGFLTGVKQIAAGNGFSAALLSDGRVMTWGHNYAYQLGDGTQQSKNAPVYVLDSMGLGEMENVCELSAGFDTLLLKTEDGNCWINGTNTYGAFGDGKTGTFSALPKRAFYVKAPNHNLTLEGRYLMVTAKRLTDPNKRFKLTYDPSKVQLKSVAAQRSIEALTAGTYGKLTVDSVADGEIVFGLDIDLPAETSWSGAITVFELKPLTEGETTVSLDVI